MKKLKLLFLSAVSLIFSGCDGSDGPRGDVIWDFMCWDVSIEVRDSQGNDLFDPHYENNVLGNKITVTYNGKTYVMGEDPDTKYYMPAPLAARAEYNEYGKKNFFCFGEFTPEDDFHGEKFTIDWGNGTKDEIEFDLFITWRKGDPTVHKRVAVNGVNVEAEDPFSLQLVRDIEVNRLVWDFTCYSVSFVVQDDMHHDLLDPENPGNLLNGLSVSYKDETYTEVEPMNKALAPLPLALREGHNATLNRKMITFGEFSPVGDHKGEKVEITWGDGSKDEIGFDLYVTWDKYYKPTVHKKFMLNGAEYKPAQDFVFSLVK